MKTHKNFHFLGIGGISMQALAKYLKYLGHTVTGQDINPSVEILGIDTSPKNAIKNLENADVVVATSAIKSDDEALVKAKSLGKQILTRGELLGKISRQFECVIAVSGTHGKTTTTEMLAEVLTEAGLNPTVHIGGVSGLFGSSLGIGEKKVFVTEACEYSGSFLYLKPDISVILNIEPEHLDYFKTFSAEQKAFRWFAKKSDCVVAENGLGLGELTFGKQGNFTATGIKKYKFGYEFWVNKNGKRWAKIKLKSFAETNILNALAVCGVCDKLGVHPKHIKNALKNFCGVKRRSEVLSLSPLVIHDYAHHPTEILGQITSIKKFFSKPVWVVFQPHTYSRTKTLFADFVNVLSKADKVFLLPTYSAREQFDEQGSSEKLFSALKKNGANAQFLPNPQTAKQTVLKQVKNQVVLVLGAGDINQFFA